MSRRCPYCAGSAEPFFARRGARYYRCPECQLVFRHPRRDGDDADYDRRFPGEWRGIGRADIYGEVLGRLPAQPGRLLDVGCGGGTLMAMAAARGWVVWGLEPAMQAHSWVANGMRGRIVTTPAELPDIAFDAVSMINVLDQIAEPWLLLRHLAGRMSRGAVFVARLPNAHLHRLWHRGASLLPGPLALRLQAMATGHDFAMEKAFLLRLMAESGLEHMRVLPSRLSRGDVYGQGVGFAVCKRAIAPFLLGASMLTRKRWPYTPSILIAAKRAAS